MKLLTLKTKQLPERIEFILSDKGRRDKDRERLVSMGVENTCLLHLHSYHFLEMAIVKHVTLESLKAHSTPDITCPSALPYASDGPHAHHLAFRKPI